MNRLSHLPSPVPSFNILKFTKLVPVPEPCSLLNFQVVDFDPKSLEKKNAANACDKETNNLLDLLANIQNDLPKENPKPSDTLKEQNTMDLSQSPFSEESSAVPREASETTETTTVTEASLNDALLPNYQAKAGFVDYTIPDLSDLMQQITSKATTEAETTTTSTTSTTETTTEKIPTFFQPILTSSQPLLTQHTVSTTSKNLDLGMKLKRLENDLKLVNEVQNILNGMNGPERIVRKKRQTFYDSGSLSKTDEPILDINLEVVTDQPSEAYVNLDTPKSREVNALGKILKWKHSNPGRCRHKRKVSKIKKKQRKFRRTNRRFLGQRYQNSL